MEYSEKYLHLGESVDPDANIICTYKIKTDMDIRLAAAAVATEQSTGTWTGISTLNDEVFKRYHGRVINIQGKIATIAYPEDDFSLDIGGVPQILSVIAGNLFGLEGLRVRLEDVGFPTGMLRAFKGPKFGIPGLRKLLNRPDKPLVGTIVKPKIGLPPQDMANFVYEAGIGGLTNCKDDETLSNQSFCPLEDRVVAIAEAIDRVKAETGHMMMHAINVSTRGDQILEVAERAQELGASELMVDVITCGFAAVQVLAEDPSIKLPIHVHRTMHGAITRNKDLGVSMAVFSKLVRMCGGDALHVGTFGVGKMKSSSADDLANQRACVGQELPYEKVMPVCSGGMHPALIEPLVKITGTDVQIQAGGGVAGHPGGVRGGARAMVQAVDAAYHGISLSEYATSHQELQEAITKWG